MLGRFDLSGLMFGLSGCCVGIEFFDFVFDFDHDLHDYRDFYRGLSGCCVVFLA